MFPLFLFWNRIYFKWFSLPEIPKSKSLNSWKCFWQIANWNRKYTYQEINRYLQSKQFKLICNSTPEATKKHFNLRNQNKHTNMCSFIYFLYWAIWYATLYRANSACWFTGVEIKKWDNLGQHSTLFGLKKHKQLISAIWMHLSCSFFSHTLTTRVPLPPTVVDVQI